MSYHQTDWGSQQYWYGIDFWTKRNVAQNVQDEVFCPQIEYGLQDFKTCVNLIFSGCFGSHPNVD